MIRYSRKLILDVFDYSGNKLCNLYDNSIDASGQAYDVFIKTERNGWREVNFGLPSIMVTEEGNEDNYRLDFIKAEYRIRAITDEGTDWFIISIPSQKHSKYQKDFDVKAGHVSQILKNKKLDLTFSDEDGNNIGTPKEFVDLILEGTGWSAGNISNFYEEKVQITDSTYISNNGIHAIFDDAELGKLIGIGSTKEEAFNNLRAQAVMPDVQISDDGVQYRAIKRRSLNASSKTGAFKLISMVCDLFDAKPIYHGDTKTVDIVPMNPFSIPADGSLPDVTEADGVIELAYSSNLKNVSRTMNSENLVTQLYAYGSYGDSEYGYCGIDECTHKEYTYTLSSVLFKDTRYKFSYTDESGTTITRSFVIDRNIPAGSKIIYSTMDPASQMYVWIETIYDYVFGDQHEAVWSDIPNEDWTKISESVNVNAKAYLVETINDGTALPCLYPTVEICKNWFSFLMDFDYFKEVNLLTDNGLQKIAGYQRYAKVFHQQIHDKSIEVTDAMLDLSETIGEVNFCKLSVQSKDYVSNCLRLKLNQDGIIYRSDYETNKKTHFKWNTTPEIKTNGDPKTEGASFLYIIHNTTPVTWDIGYLKAMDDSENPSYLTFHINSDVPVNIETDKFYLFGSNNINGRLGQFQSSDEAIVTTSNTKLKVITVPHDIQYGTSVPINVTISGSNNAGNPNWLTLEEYGWFWNYNTSTLYFCYYDHYGENTETSFRRVYYQQNEPDTASQYSYWYNWATSVLSRKVDDEWVALTSDTEKEVASCFGSVYKACRDRDKLYKGVPEYYSYTIPNGGLAKGNYYIESPYDDIYVFTIKENLSAGTVLRYNTTDGIVEQISSDYGSISADLTAELGTINQSTGELIADDSKCRSAEYISVTPGNNYSFSGFTSVIPLTIYKYNNNHEFIEAITDVSGYDGSIIIETGIRYIKFSCDVSYQTFNNYTNFNIKTGTIIPLEAKTYRFDNVKYHPANIYDTIMEQGDIDSTDGSYKDEGSDKLNCGRSRSFSSVYPNNTYQISRLQLNGNWVDFYVHMYDSNKNYIKSELCNTYGYRQFTTTQNTYYVKYSVPKPAWYALPDIDAENPDAGYKPYATVFNELVENNSSFKIYNIIRDDTIIIKDNNYFKLESNQSGENHGIISLTQKFTTLADKVYLVLDPALRLAQKSLNDFTVSMSTELGDMYREGYWQKSEYVDGDEDLLYSDALDTIKQISKPQPSYMIEYLDLYDSNSEMDYGITPETIETSWPDLSIMSAVHLVDPEINVNCWAYMETINKCYDKPWRTNITINTEMTTLAQHTFSDVMANIANIASSMKAKETLFDRIKVIDKEGTINASNVKGEINLTNTMITGGASNWTTDENGNILFLSADGSNAMLLSGAGFALANSKDVDGNWQWTMFGTGDGLNAEAITTGKITVNQVSSDFGQNLDISSNESIILASKTAEGIINSYLEIADDHITIFSNGNLNLLSDSNLNVRDGGNINISAGGNLSVDTGGKFYVSSESIYIGTRSMFEHANLMPNSLGDNLSGYVYESAWIYNKSYFDIGQYGDACIYLYPASNDSLIQTPSVYLTADNDYVFSCYVMWYCMNQSIDSIAVDIDFVYYLKGSSEKHTITLFNDEVITSKAFTRISNSFTAPANISLGYIEVRNVGEDYLCIERFQIEEGTELTEWKPYVNNTSSNSLVMNDQGISIAADNGSIILDHTGINMSGGSVDIRSDGNFNVQSGGTVIIEAREGTGSYISLGSGNFSVSTAGDISASTGVFRNGLYVGQYKVLTEENAGGVSQSNVVVSNTQPTGSGIIWVKPSATISSGSFATMRYNGSATSLSISSQSTRSIPLTQVTGFDGTAVTQYSVSFYVKAASASRNNGYAFFDSDISVAIRDGNTSNSVTLTPNPITVQTHESRYTLVTFTGLSNASGSHVNAIGTGDNVFLDVTFSHASAANEAYIYVMTNENLEFSVTAKSNSTSGSSTSSICEVYYIA